MGMYDVAPVEQPNIIHNMLQSAQLIKLLEGDKPGFGDQNAAVNLMKLEEEKRKASGKEMVERNEFALNALSGVTSDEDLQVAKRIFASRYPGHAEYVDTILPSYNERELSLIRNSLRTETERVKSEENAAKINAYSPGSDLYQGDKKIGSVAPIPTKPEFELFEDRKGNQVYMQKGGTIPKGYKKVMGKSGGVTVNMGEGKPAPSSERTQMNLLFDLKKKLRTVRGLYKPEFVGRLEGPIGSAKELTGIRINKDQVKFKQLVNTVADDLLRAKSGAQINEMEFKRLKELVPDVNLPDDAFMARFEQFYDNLDEMIDTRRTSLKESGMRPMSGGFSGNDEGEVTVTRDPKTGKLRISTGK